MILLQDLDTLGRLRKLPSLLFRGVNIPQGLGDGPSAGLHVVVLASHSNLYWVKLGLILLIHRFSRLLLRNGFLIPITLWRISRLWNLLIRILAMRVRFNIIATRHYRLLIHWPISITFQININIFLFYICQLVNNSGVLVHLIFKSIDLLLDHKLLLLKCCIIILFFWGCYRRHFDVWAWFHYVGSLLLRKILRFFRWVWLVKFGHQHLRQLILLGEDLAQLRCFLHKTIVWGYWLRNWWLIICDVL